MPDPSKPKRPAGASPRKGGLGGGPSTPPAAASKAAKSRGIGRGLAAILDASPAPGGGAASATDTELRDLPVALIGPNPGQPRRRFDPDDLQALADSIADQGILQPVLVRPRPGGRFEIVAGERRWRAAQLADLETIPAIVRERTDAQTLEAALVENMARADLTPIEEARACAGLVEELGLSREEVAKRVGRSRSAVSNLIRLLDLPDEVVDLLEARSLTEGHGRALLLAPDQGTRKRLALQAVDQGWSVREVERMARPSDAPAKASGPKPSGTKPTTSAAATGPAADHLEAAEKLSDELSVSLGLEVRVKPHKKGFRVELDLDDLAEAERFTDRLS
ncbi:MAG: ParB/RepB/Spo0J family partition protein [Solirubrobacteraceae bacterium]|nr:ParB/RepB/Spo0J family partition protein [Solirubrobacteraceae bacterium]